MRTLTRHISLLVSAVLLQACTGLKYATEERPLFTGFEVVFSTPQKPMSARHRLNWKRS